MKSGDTLLIGSDASPQFGIPIQFRLIRVLDRPTYHGWAWVDGYELNRRGDAFARRELFVQPAGVTVLASAL